jgi:hypothetical protein
MADSKQSPKPWTPGPWSYVPSNENHGPYITSDFGSTICDCYTMSNPLSLAVCNGGDSRPISFLAEMADPNARLIAQSPRMADYIARHADAGCEEAKKIMEAINASS